MAFGLAVFGRQKRLDEIPRYGWSHRPAAHAKDIHVIVLDPLLGRKMIVDQRRANTLNLIGTHRRAHAAAADRYAAIHLARPDSRREGNTIVGIVVALSQAMSAKIDDLMPSVTKLGNQLLLQTKSAVIGGNSHAHISSSLFSRHLADAGSKDSEAR